MTFALRHSKDSRVHFSDAKRMAVSPAHARYGATHPTEPTPAMRRGTAIDRLVLGERRKLVVYKGERGTKTWAAIEAVAAGVDVAVYPGAVRNGKEWAAFEAMHPGRVIALDKEYQAAWDLLGGKPCDLGEIVTPDEYEAAAGAAEAVQSDPVVRDLGLLIGEHQRVIQWDMHGLPWAAGIAGERGGFDVFGLEHIADLKATACTEPIQWSRQARRMLYPEQLAAYRTGALEIGRKIAKCYLIGVEVKAPYVVTVLEIPEHDLAEAERTIYAWCERIRACEASDHWPGYVQTAWPLEPKSAWEMAGESE